MATPSTDRGNAIETAAMLDSRRHGSFAVTRGSHVGHGDAQAIGSKTPRRGLEPIEIRAQIVTTRLQRAAGGRSRARCRTIHHRSGSSCAAMARSMTPSSLTAFSSDRS